MKTQLIYGLGLLLAAQVCAQSALYSPKSMASTEGQFYGYAFLRYSDQRIQNVDGENRGTAAAITSISFRLDNRSHYSALTGGRTWSNVTMKVSEGDVANFTTNFANNTKTTPTTVYNKAWGVPLVIGFPLLKPAVWGGLKGEYTIPFSTAWVYTGKGDILTDWKFTGGKLANNVVWATNSARNYYLDGYGNFMTPTGSTGYIHQKYIPAVRLNNNSLGVTGRCNDSAHTTTTGAYYYNYAYLYAKYYSNRSWSDKMRFYSQSYYTAPGAPVIHAYAVQVDVAGLDLGTGCNKLHVKGPLFLVMGYTNPAANSTNGYSGYYETFVPFLNVFRGLDMIGQAAWADSKSGALNLSWAHHIKLPDPQPAPKRSATYHYIGTNTTGFGPYTNYPYSPAVCYQKK
jgi:hypothetical protein